MSSLDPYRLSLGHAAGRLWASCAPAYVSCRSSVEGSDAGIVMIQDHNSCNARVGDPIGHGYVLQSTRLSAQSPRASTVILLYRSSRVVSVYLGHAVLRSPSCNVSSVPRFTFDSQVISLAILFHRCSSLNSPTNADTDKNLDDQ